MARDPYQVLGVPAAASDSDIRAAFRKLAKQYHPDRNPGDKKSEDRFKEVSAAFDILGDADRRRKFDRGEIDADGRERAPQFRQWGGAAGGAGPGSGGFNGGRPGGAGPGGGFDDLGDIFADLFNARTRAGSPGAMRGRDVRYRLEVDFLDAVRGVKKRVAMPDGRNLDVAIPAGLEEGQTLRLRGQGEAGVNGGPPGDVYVETQIKSHPVFEREGLDIHVEAPITLKEAVLGGKITVPTIGGDVSVTAPKGASSGAVLRLKGRGVAPGRGMPPGDQYVKLKIVLPENDPELEAFVREWKAADAVQPRKHFADV